MYQIEITSHANSKRVYRKSFVSKSDANKWFNAQQAKRAIARNFGASFSTLNIEVSKLY